LSRKGWFLLLLVSAMGCSRREQVPTITRAEFDVVQAHRPTRDDPERYLTFTRSDRGRDIVSRRLRNVFSDRGIAIVKGADRAEAYRIRDGRGEGPFGSIEGYPITAVGKGADPALARRFVEPLLDGSRYFASPDCFINPGVAYRLRAAEGSVSLVVCYECDNIDVYVRDEHGRLTHRGGAFLYDPLGGPKGLVRIAKEAFPDDGEIQKLGDQAKVMIPVEMPNVHTREP
jgi:hypothetical protein